MPNGEEKSGKVPSTVSVPRVRIVECKYPQMEKDGVTPKEATIDGKQHNATALIAHGVDPMEIKTWKDCGNAIVKAAEVWDQIRQGASPVNSKGNVVTPKPFYDGDTRAQACSTEERFFPRELVSAEFTPAMAYEKFMQGIEAPIRTAINNALRQNFSEEAQQEGTGGRSSEKNVDF